jgi:hypothetical protein
VIALTKSIHHRDAGHEKKSLFAQNEQLQVVDFVQAKISILIVFGFFLMTAECAEFGVFLTKTLYSASSAPPR